jgi:hypothetical protein
MKGFEGRVGFYNGFEASFGKSELGEDEGIGD